MLIYENLFSMEVFPSLEHFFPALQLRRHIAELLDSSPTSQFCCRIEENIPNVDLYLIEYNQPESYTIYHLFTYDRLGEDYSYQHIPLNQIQILSQLALRYSDNTTNPDFRR
jgi:hypothetical protein